uniref:Uncharacterized protein n=1 Tax=viral metagenome TaxID=1070528 RepID=A0A6C0M0Y4_9ZZZZ
MDTYADGVVRIASFDIGRRNFAFYTEDAGVATIKTLHDKYHCLPKKYQRKAKGVMNEHVDAMLTEMYTHSHGVENGYGVFDFTEESDRSLTIRVRSKLQELLRSYMWLWETCDMIVIEQQFFNPRCTHKGKDKDQGANVDAIKLGETCLSWFVDTFYPFKHIEYFGSMWKTTTLGAPQSVYKTATRGKDRGVSKWVPMSKSDRKAWSIEKAMAISELRKDDAMAGMFRNGVRGMRKRGGHKMDDIADCLVQCQAYKFRKLIVG